MTVDDRHRPRRHEPARGGRRWHARSPTPRARHGAGRRAARSRRRSSSASRALVERSRGRRAGAGRHRASPRCCAIARARSPTRRTCAGATSRSASCSRRGSASATGRRLQRRQRDRSTARRVAGAARGCRDVLGVYVGTGIGGGVIANGRLVEGTTQLRRRDRPRQGAVGRRGRAVRVRSARLRRGLPRRLRTCCAGSAPSTGARIDSRGHRDVDPRRRPRRRRPVGARPVARARAAARGALGNAVAVLNPERLVLGGGVLARCPTLYRLVTEVLAETTNGPSWGPLSVVLAELGDDAGLVGAAHLAAS